MEFAKMPVAPRFVIADFSVIPAPFVIADLIRNPVHAWRWIPDVETPDLIRGRDDNGRVRDHNGISIFSISLTK